MDTLLVSFDDADIYERDLMMFKPGCWLNDSCINYCLKRFVKVDRRIACLDPAVVSFLRLQAEEEEDEDLVVSLGMNNATWVVLPVNDNESFTSSSNHWSLLLFHIHSGKSFHFDSSRGFNTHSSTKVAARVATLTRTSRGDIEADQVVQVSGCPQQGNGFDCGVYCILFAKYICDYLSNDGDMLVTSVIGSGGRVLSRILSDQLEGDQSTALRLEAAADIEAQSVLYLQSTNTAIL